VEESGKNAENAHFRSA